MMKYDVVLLTESRYENPPNPDWYEQQILTEDGYVMAALQQHGLTVRRVNWASPDFDWSSTRLAVFRTTWDYFHRLGEFSAWLDRVTTQTRLLNAPDTIRWNMDKHYLLDLEAQGIRIPPTRIVHRDEVITLETLHQETGWHQQETILKPTISGGARHTYRLNPDSWAAHENIFQQLIAQEDMMLQPLQHRVLSEGEMSLMVMGGRFTHAVLKIAKPGDFRVQDDFGGTAHPHIPAPEAIELAERAVAACQPLPLYARVDLITDNEGELAVMEMELIEPELWFRYHPPAAEVLAEAIAAFLA